MEEADDDDGGRPVVVAPSDQAVLHTCHYVILMKKDSIPGKKRKNHVCVNFKIQGKGDVILKCNSSFFHDIKASVAILSLSLELAPFFCRCSLDYTRTRFDKPQQSNICSVSPPIPYTFKASSFLFRGGRFPLACS